MQPTGIILTIMRWNKPLWWPFNIGLLLWQLEFLIIGKIIGKIKATWKQIWKAVFVCHVRLCLRQDSDDSWQYISFTAPDAKYDYFTLEIIKKSKGHFIYLDPAFDSSLQFIGAMQRYADDQIKKPVARKYDYLQLLSFCVNLPLWIFYCPSWGKEIIKWFNLPGGREVCSTGVTACLRWAEFSKCYPIARQVWPDALMGYRISRFFTDYKTAMVSPCLFAISGNWGGNK